MTQRHSMELGGANFAHVLPAREAEQRLSQTCAQRLLQSLFRVIWQGPPVLALNASGLPRGLDKGPVTPCEVWNDLKNSSPRARISGSRLRAEILVHQAVSQSQLCGTTKTEHIQTTHSTLRSLETGGNGRWNDLASSSSGKNENDHGGTIRCICGALNSGAHVTSSAMEKYRNRNADAPTSGALRCRWLCHGGTLSRDS